MTLLTVATVLSALCFFVLSLKAIANLAEVCDRGDYKSATSQIVAVIAFFSFGMLNFGALLRIDHIEKIAGRQIEEAQINYLISKLPPNKSTEAEKIEEQRNK